MASVVVLDLSTGGKPKIQLTQKNKNKKLKDKILKAAFVI